ncbi:hypothetical protein GFY24_00735 [Nocardia sp. SYP-A9097]|nr:hypothetical protein [Nocardia sp. SYP-A9097]MRH86003.1 hypothetical protein [Nocardia sp. SYP-A9097]
MGCNCGPTKLLHQVVHPGGKTITYASEPEAREVARQVGGTYQAIQR